MSVCRTLQYKGVLDNMVLVVVSSVCVLDVALMLTHK